jgi:hypothetical protein
MKVYQTKIKQISGSDYSEVYGNVWELYRQIKKKSKRKPYIRSAYFGNDKIFIDYFWEHLHQKHQSDRFRRLKFYSAAVDLLKNSRVLPTIKPHVNKPYYLLYRFLGKDPEGSTFAVQVLHGIKTNKKYFLSVFPYDIAGEE